MFSSAVHADLLVRNRRRTGLTDATSEDGQRCSERSRPFVSHTPAAAPGPGTDARLTGQQAPEQQTAAVRHADMLCPDGAPRLELARQVFGTSVQEMLCS
jgi:hypothetical protein